VGMASAASGADTLFLEAAARRGMPLRVVLPFELPRFRQDHSALEWARVQPLLSAAIEHIVVRGAESDDEAYLDAGVLAVDECDVLLAVWDGEPAAGRGGTAEVVAYAESLRTPLMIIHPATGETSLRRGENLPVTTAHEMPACPRARVEAHARHLDDVASRESPQARPTVLRIILLHLLAASVAVVGWGLGAAGALAYAAGFAQVTALAWAALLASRHHRAQSASVEARPGAELCRSFLAVWHLRREGALLPRLPAGVPSRLARSLEILWLLDREAQLPLEQARQQYLRERVDERQACYGRELGRAAPSDRLLRRVALYGTWSAIAAGSTAIALLAGSPFGAPYQAAKVLSILLPVATAALLSLAVSLDLNRRAHRHGEMQRELEAGRLRVMAAQTWPGLWRAVADIERHLLEGG
jgi:hypothetical protein